MNQQLSLPTARHTAPATSHLAAVSLRRADPEIVWEIRHVLERYALLTHEEIAYRVDLAQPDRWTEGTIVSACARSGLYAWPCTVRNKRGHAVGLWALDPPDPDVETVLLAGEFL